MSTRVGLCGCVQTEVRPRLPEQLHHSPSQHLVLSDFSCRPFPSVSSLHCLCFPNGGFLWSFAHVLIGLFVFLLLGLSFLVDKSPLLVSVLQVLSPHLWLFIHLLDGDLHRVQVFNSGEVQLLYFLNRLCFGYRCLRMFYVTIGHEDFLLKFYNFMFYI